MGKLFYIVGKSSAGKDTLAKALIEDETLGLKEVTQYTTRPMRPGEQDGKEYRFISMEESVRLREEGKIIEERSYNTVYGIWKYMLVDDGKIDLENENYLTSGTVESYLETREALGADNVVPVYIYVETGERLQRALDREKKSGNPKYAEMCRRFLADEADFDEAHLKSAGLMDEKGGYMSGFENRDFKTCLEKIRGFIKNLIR